MLIRLAGSDGKCAWPTSIRIGSRFPRIETAGRGRVHTLDDQVAVPEPLIGLLAALGRPRVGEKEWSAGAQFGLHTSF